jgi:hypothetical protein
MPRLTEEELLLFIHPALKERASAIGGYKWDAERRCWVYPRTRRVYDALVAEFGDDLHMEKGSDEPSAPLQGRARMVWNLR